MRVEKKISEEDRSFLLPLKWGRKTVKEREKHYREKKRKRHEEDSEIVAKVIPREKRNKRGKRQKANKEKKVKLNEEEKKSLTRAQ